MAAHLIAGAGAAIDAFVTALKATGIRSVETDPAKLNLPGALVELERIRFDLLDGFVLVLRVSLVAPDVDPRRSMDTLAGLFDMAAELVDPDGDLAATTIPLPEQSSPMPALQFTHEIPTT